MALPRELVIHIDGASRGNPGPASAGVEIRDAHKKVLREISQGIGVATNNIAEYSALVFALEEAAILKAKKITVYTDSELLARQFSGQYRVKDPALKLLYVQAKRLALNFSEIEVLHVPREENREADRLANQALNQELF